VICILGSSLELFQDYQQYTAERAKKLTELKEKIKKLQNELFLVPFLHIFNF